MKRFNLLNNQRAVENTQDYSINEGNSSSSLFIIFLPFVVVFVIIFLLHYNKGLAGVENMPVLAKKLKILKQEYSNTLVLQQENDEKYNHLLKEKEQLNNDLLTLNNLGSEASIDTYKLLSDISNYIPNDVALIKINKKNKNLLLSGLSKNYESLMNFVRILSLNNILKNIEIQKSSMGNAYGRYKQSFVIIGIL